MLTREIQRAINAQINAEYWSAYLYLSMSMAAEQRALSGFANWFYVQWLEEQDHARILQQYMIAQDAPVRLDAIANVPTEWKCPREMMELTLEHEQEVTSMINELMDMASEEHDYATMSRLQWFVDEQVEEEQQARAILDVLKQIDNDPAALYEYECWLGKREYKSASALQ